MLRGTLNRGLSRHARTCGDAGIDGTNADPDACGHGRECCWGCIKIFSTTLQWGEGCRQHCCMTVSTGNQQEPKALHDVEHLGCCRACAMGARAVLGHAVRPRDEYLPGWHTACRVDQTVCEPALGDDPLCRCCLPSQPLVLTKAEPGTLCVDHDVPFCIATEPASLGDRTLGTFPWPSRPTCILEEPTSLAMKNPLHAPNARQQGNSAVWKHWRIHWTEYCLATIALLPHRRCEAKKLLSFRGQPHVLQYGLYASPALRFSLYRLLAQTT